MTEVALMYGKSLFDLAQEEGKAREYMQELSVIRDCVEKEPQLIALLASRAVAKQERIQVLDACFGGKTEPYILNFMKILCQNEAIRELTGCIRQFELLFHEACGILEVKAVSAVPLSPTLRKKLEDKLSAMTGKTVSVRYATDPSVLGSMRLEMNGTELDGSVRRRLDEIAKVLANLTI